MSVTFGPRGITLVSGADDSTLKLWDVDTGKAFRTFQGHNGRVNSAAFGPGGRTLVSASSDCTLKIWDLSTGACLKTIPLLWKPLHIAAPAPHRPGIFAVANSNGTVALFDLGKILGPG